MIFSVLTIFPDYFESVWPVGLLGKACNAGLIEIRTRDIREYSTDKHRKVDDEPFGGGAGMVMMPQPIVDAVNDVRLTAVSAQRTVLLTPAGEPFTQAKASEYAELDHLILVCGRYEGVDQRAIDACIDEELSIGDYVLGGGEAAATVVVEATARLIPGLVGNPDSLHDESFEDGLLSHPVYTRPAEWEGQEVPPVLLSGHHAEIEKWRHEQREQRTKNRRPDLLKK